jgi:hypothetical protein
MFQKRNERIERANEMMERDLDREREPDRSSYGSHYVSDVELFRKMGINTRPQSKGVN